jgi:hypothetical protein
MPLLASVTVVMVAGALGVRGQAGSFLLALGGLYFGVALWLEGRSRNK